jgi:hypothetical protein
MAKQLRQRNQRPVKASSTTSNARKKEAPVLLSGGNPRIAKADGDAPVRAYLAALPGWKRQVGKRLDALIVRTVPGVRKFVKWNSPMYGIDGRGLFLGFHTFTHYLKVTFFRGTSLRPVPPGGQGKDARWIDIHEHDLDEAQMADWLCQAAALPGWVPGQRDEQEETVKTQPKSRKGAAGDWRVDTLARIRALIMEAVPGMTEERKWIKPTNPSGVPVWSHAGMVCTGETYAKVVKLTFAHGASLPDPSRLFNASLEGNARRAIDIHEGEQIDARAFKALVKAAVARNAALDTRTRAV